MTDADKADLAADLAAATTRTERTEVIDEYCSIYRVRSRTVYRWAREGGYENGRKKRSDAGTRKCAVPLEAIREAAMAKFKSTTGKYHSPMPAEVAIDITGGAAKGVKPHHVNKYLRERKLDRRSARKPTPHITRRSERPNDEHQFDTSACAVWYLDAKARLRVNPGAGKDQNKKRRGRQIIRYVVTDHMTNTVFFQYLMEYESFKSSAGFLNQAWSRKPDPDLFPFCGVPKRLFLDQGPTFKSRHIKALCESLGIELMAKQPTGTRSKSGKMGSPRTLGSVERTHWIIEQHFETRTRLQKPQTLEELNQWAYRWAIWHNATKILERIKMPRFHLWCTIRSEELRMPPADLDVFMSLAESPQECHIYPDLTIRFRGNRYRIEGIPVDLRGTTARVSYSPYKLPEIRVLGSDGSLYVAHPMTRMDYRQGGYYEDAVLTGEYKSFKDTTREKEEKRAELHTLGEVDPFPNFAERLEKVRFMHQPGTEIGAEMPPEKLDWYHALLRIRELLGRAITTDENLWLRNKYGDWMTEREIETALKNLQGIEEKRQLRRPYYP